MAQGGYWNHNVHYQPVAGTVSETEPPTAASALSARPVAVLVTAGSAPEVIALTVPVTS